MTASKMKKYPILASSSRSSLLPTNHKQNTSSSSSSPSSLLLSSSSHNFCGGEASSSSSSSKRIFNNYLSSANELTMIDRSSDKQVDSLFDSTYNNLESRETSKLNLTCCHGLKRHTKETNTMTPHSFPSNEQLKSIVNKVEISLCIYYIWSIL